MSNNNLIDLDTVLKDLGYSSKQKAVEYLIRNFIQDIHYIKHIAQRKAGKGYTRITKYSLKTNCYAEWQRKRNERKNNTNRAVA